MNNPEICDIQPKKLIGICMTTSLADDKTGVLWNRFMKLKNSIENVKSDALFSVQNYDADFIKGNFNSQSLFEKWAAIEVEGFTEVPSQLESLELPGGKYAVFIHRGTSRQFAESASFIFEEWLPSSNFELDDRPHFEVMGKAYKGHDNPQSEEEIWIPIKPKN
ncbi:GyrI-like domain-containing protein [Christiangramia salexigens]|uniref:GyrI-like domain-containing protein n=1 Tax=Christiangramia salexigens TaxID=1913577 RepID=A0A1L3J2Y4_9FLAO|nr:GyrI-like domain-containing protein [Christiangramia salexigens]APG59485.1 GyrI-like domain-containing protein [Christiangramia salexigens]